MVTVAEEVIEAAKRASKRCATPREDFPGLGAAVKAQDDNIYTGSVVETRDRHQSIHAERLAVSNAITATDEENLVTEVAVHIPLAYDGKSNSASVCGSCLHMISEYSSGNIPIHIECISGSKRRKLRDLYPDPWLDSWDEETQ